MPGPAQIPSGTEVGLGKHVKQSLEEFWNLKEAEECWMEPFSLFTTPVHPERVPAHEDQETSLRRISRPE